MSKSFSDNGFAQEDKRLLANMTGLSLKADNTGCPCFGSFLDIREQSLVSAQHTDLVLYGGYEGAERRMAGFGKPSPEEFPLTALEITTPSASKPLRHQDVLRSIMALGIERSVTGDIILKDEHTAIFFVKNDFINYFTSNLTKIASSYCEIRQNPDLTELENVSKTELFTVSVASLRLDCVTAAALKTSREKAVELIEAKKVFLNRLLCEDLSHAVREGDQLIVRGYGKFVLSRLNGSTKKGRVSAQIEKYI